MNVECANESTATQEKVDQGQMLQSSQLRIMKGHETWKTVEHTQHTAFELSLASLADSESDSEQIKTVYQLQ